MAKILVIEDDALVSRMYVKVLQQAGYEVELSINGREGVEKAKSFVPDLIFCDVMMPETNGLEVLDQLKSDPTLKNVPVIMLTNLSGTQDAQLATQKGALKYLVKSEHKPKDLLVEAQGVLG